MTIYFIAPIPYIILEGEQTVHLQGNWKLMPGKDCAYLFENHPEFLGNIGSINQKLIYDSYVFKMEYIITIPLKQRQIDELAEIILGNYLVYIKNLWLIRDNSCYVNHCFTWNVDRKYSKTYIKDAINTNAEDTFYDTAFTKGELLDYDKYYNSVRSIIVRPPETPAIPERVEEASMTPVPMNAMPYQFNRIYRANLFISFARKTGIIISKISFYMSAYECLFTSNNNLVTENVTKRPSHFLGGSQDEIAATKKLIKRAYSIRSLFIHGEVIHATPDELKKLSRDIDTLTRKIMNKVLADKGENKIFTIKEDYKGKEEFETYFNLLTGTTVARKKKKVRIIKQSKLPPYIKS